MMKKEFIFVLLAAAIVVLAGCTPQQVNVEQNDNGQMVQQQTQQEGTAEVYNPQLVPAEFSTNIDNKYFTLTPRTKFRYESQTEDGLETNEVYVTEDTRIVAGIEARVVWDRVWLDGDLIEETYDWYAQDSDGNVWYLGEDSVEMAQGKITSHAGSWETGVDGALPGIIMEANPKVGDTYRQEYLAGEAEDQADVLALGESVSMPYSKFSDCLKTLDYNPLEPGGEEDKYYCTSVRFNVLEVGREDGERVELVSVEYDVDPSPSTITGQPEEVQTSITEEEAKAIALSEVPGVVTDVSIETKYGKLAYVVEVDADSGPETDVVIDIDSGEVLGIET